FFFLLMPRLLAGRCTPRRLAGYAIDLSANGSRRLGNWCWNRAVRGSVHDEPTRDILFGLCITAGHFDAAAIPATRFYATSGLSPAAAVRHTGTLILNGAYAAALELYDRLLEHCGEEFAERCPAPAWDSPVDGRKLRALVAAETSNLTDGPSDTGELELGF